MKKLFTTLALGSAFATGAFAQKNIDLEVEFVSPVDSQEYANLANGDTFKFEIKITNNGPDAVTTTDTLGMYMLGNLFALADGSLAYDGPTIAPSVALAAGESTTLTYSNVKGSGYVNADGDTMVYFFPDDNFAEFWFTSDPDNKMSFFVGVFGFDAAGDLFNDDGLVIEDGSISDFTGNNMHTVKGIKFGELSASDLKGLDKKQISVYPNPTTNDINFTYSFDKASTTAVARVLDVTGKVVMTHDFGKQSAGEQRFNLNVGSLPAGIYTLEFVAEENRGISKFTIK